jgi:uncharacterized membrane protein (DUF485 family)
VTTENGSAAMQRDPSAAAGIRRRLRFSFALAGLISTAYALLVLAMAFEPGLLALPVAAGRATTWGLLSGIGFALLTVAGMGIFVRHRTVLDHRGDDR